MSPNATDMHGNTAVHQAAASGNDEVLKCFMARGVDVVKVNAREHTPLMLATKQGTRDLIAKAVGTIKCPGPVCGKSTFDFQNIRYYCQSCGDFFCVLDSIRTWVYENKNSTAKERPVCRCHKCAADIAKAEGGLQEAINSHRFEVVDKVVHEILAAGTDIDVQMKDEAQILHLKLEKELDIRNYIESLAHIDNYKTIRKSANILLQKMKNAQDLNVNLDEQLMEDINNCHARLLSERELRNEMEVTNIMESTTESIENMSRLI